MLEFKNFDNQTDEQILQWVRNNVDSTDLLHVRLSVMRGKVKKGINIMTKKSGYLSRKVMLVSGSLNLGELKAKTKEVADVMRQVDTHNIVTAIDDYFQKAA